VPEGLLGFCHLPGPWTGSQRLGFPGIVSQALARFRTSWRRLTHPGAVSLALRELRKRNLGKVLKFRGEVGMREISKKAETHMVRVLVLLNASVGDVSLSRHVC
jgi:hypothetical protein